MLPIVLVIVGLAFMDVWLPLGYVFVIAALLFSGNPPADENGGDKT